MTVVEQRTFTFKIDLAENDYGAEVRELRAHSDPDCAVVPWSGIADFLQGLEEATGVRAESVTLVSEVVGPVDISEGNVTFDAEECDDCKAAREADESAVAP